MSVSVGPKIVTDGLLSYYDPGNKLSYIGSGSALNDLTNNRDATLTGSPPFNKTFSAPDLILRNKSDYGGQVAGLPNGSWDIHVSFIAIYFRDTTLFGTSGTFVNGTDTLYILNTDGSLFFSIDSSVSSLIGVGSSNGQAVKYTLLDPELDGFAAPNNTTSGQTFNNALAAASSFSEKKTAWQNYVNANITLPASGGSPFNSIPFKVDTQLPNLTPALDTFTFEDNDSITLNLPVTQQYTYEFIFSPVDYTDAVNNNYQRMLISSASSNFIVLEENRVFRHRVPGVDATGNIGGNTVFDIGEFAVATFSYDQSVSKNYRNGVLLNSKSIGSGTVSAGTLDLFTNGAFQQFVGGFGFFRAYDRALSDIEVLNNYHAIKGRFGL